MTAVRVMIVDDHPLFRSGIRALIASARGFVVVGEASNGQEAVDLAPTLKPDIVIMDLEMPVLGGDQATRCILNERPRTKVIVVSANESRQAEKRATEAGAAAFVPKTSCHSELVPLAAALTRHPVAINPASARLI